MVSLVQKKCQGISDYATLNGGFQGFHRLGWQAACSLVLNPPQPLTSSTPLQIVNLKVIEKASLATSIEVGSASMALSLAKAAPLKPEIRLAQALSEFEAILPDDQKTQLRTYRGQSPPDPTDVMRFTADIDRDADRNRKSRQCVGTRLTNVLHAIQQFSTIVDFIIGSSQSPVASAIWGTVKISLKVSLMLV